ncbi:hypothetical protein DXG01_000546 [Tephrocybe rancida]|nr:hypothetical protein DXG01_000546 [Tephrocybe rancida]
MYHGATEFPGNENAVSHPSQKVALFSRQPVTDEIYLNMFSVAQKSTDELVKSRAIVVYEGTDHGEGRWRCMKDSKGDCPHVAHAKTMLEKFAPHTEPGSTTNINGIDTEAESATGATVEEYNMEIPEPGGNSQRPAVSHMAIMPPPWAALERDPSLYPQPAPFTTPPACLKLDTNSTCPCTKPRCEYNMEKPVEEFPCLVFGLTQATETLIELQDCALCSGRWRQWVGPDLREVGIFNFNNKMLFTHELLDDYTSCYTSSETPFTSWIKVTSRRYDLHKSTVPFVSDHVFRAVWFAYANLQDFGDDMECVCCGPAPENVIWDSVTVGFNKKHALATLRPLTISGENAPSRSTTTYIKKPQVLADAILRRELRKVLKAGNVLSQAVADSDDDESVVEQKKTTAAENAEAERLKLIPIVTRKLIAVSPSLAAIFIHFWGPSTPGASKKQPALMYKKLFNQIAAEESVVQMLNRSALKELEGFIQRPSWDTASRLIDCPVLREVLKAHVTEEYPMSVMGICEWLHERSKTVHTLLMNNDCSTTSLATLDLPQLDWREDRPTYDRLSGDKKQDSGANRGDKCSKYYATYGTKTLTGGLMVAWCTHSICYGFHFIPNGEGRNDVFSAMYTRWPKAPKRIVYDFACALGPYCMTREPDFFADSLFMVDEFHAMDHKKCAPAAFAHTYMAVDPHIALLNTSAAECGNGGIKRIRKAVSYMGQGNAIVYTKVFISIWNRLRIREKFEGKR